MGAQQLNVCLMEGWARMLNSDHLTCPALVTELLAPVTQMCITTAARLLA